jgi:hypothetical protein
MGGNQAANERERRWYVLMFLVRKLQTTSVIYKFPPPPPHLPEPPLIIDTGTTGHYLAPTTACNNKCPMLQPINCNMPNGTTMQSSHKGNLPLKTNILPAKAGTTHIFPALETHSLVSVGNLLWQWMHCNIWCCRWYHQ